MELTTHPSSARSLGFRTPLTKLIRGRGPQDPARLLCGQHHCVGSHRNDRLTYDKPTNLPRHVSLVL